MSSKSGNTLDYGIFAYVEYTISSTSTKTTLSVTKAVARTALPNVGINDMTGKFTDSSKVNATKSVTGQKMRSSADVTMFSSFTWSWDNGTTALSVTVDFKITSNGGTSTASIPVNVPALAKYTISYNGNNATSGSVSSQTKYYGKALTLRTNSFIRTGYTFYKWNTNAAGTGTAYNSGGTLPANVNATTTLHAQWTPVSYTVTLDANGGVSGSTTSISRTYASPFVIPQAAIPTRSGYKFLGWAESDTVTTAKYTHTGGTTGTCTISDYNAVTGDKTLYAVWKVAYNKPEITDLVAYRVDSSASSSETNEGTFIYVTFGYTKGSINGSYRVTDYKITIDGTQVTSDSLSSNTGTIPTISASTVAYGSYETSTPHTVVVTLSDNEEPNYEKAESSVIVSSSIYPIDLIGDGNNVYMGLMHQAVSGKSITSNSLYVDGTINCTNLFISGMIGVIQMFGGTTPPNGWLICDGSAVSRTTYSQLFNVIGVAHGTGDGSNTFNLPDLIGRVPIGVGTGTASTSTNHALGDKGGQETHTLTTAQMPKHTHTFTGDSHTHYTAGDSTRYVPYATTNRATSRYALGTEGYAPKTDNSNTWAWSRATNSVTVTGTNAQTGSGDAHNNMQPYTTVNFIIFTGVSTQ